MTAFTIEVLLLLTLAFLLGLALGFKLGRRSAAAVADSEAASVVSFTGRLPVHEAGDPDARPDRSGPPATPSAVLPFSAAPTGPGTAGRRRGGGRTCSPGPAWAGSPPPCRGNRRRSLCRCLCLQRLWCGRKDRTAIPACARQPSTLRRGRERTTSSC